MIPKEHLDALEIDAILTNRNSESRKQIFADLSLVYCFTCGAMRGENGDCPCLIERLAELIEQQDKIL